MRISIEKNSLTCLPFSKIINLRDIFIQQQLCNIEAVGDSDFTCVALSELEAKQIENTIK